MRAIFWPAEDESMDKIIIRPMTPEDWSTVSRIYVEGIATEYATFQTECPPYTAWDASHTKECRLVILSGGVLAGWCALHRVDPRWCYRGVAEVSIYVGERPVRRCRKSRVLDAAIHRFAGQRRQPCAARQVRFPAGGTPGTHCAGLPRPLAGHLSDGAPRRRRRAGGVQKAVTSRLAQNYFYLQRGKICGFSPSAFSRRI